MNKQSWLYKVTASMVSLAMFLQVVLPVFALPSPQPVQADETLTVLRETAVAANAPDTLARPLAITRAQSSYQAGGDITVTYTVQNNLSATYFPDIDAGLNVTETVAAWRDHAPAVFPLPHPSWRNTGWLRRNPWFEAELLPALRARVAEVLR